MIRMENKSIEIKGEILDLMVEVADIIYNLFETVENDPDIVEDMLEKAILSATVIGKAHFKESEIDENILPHETLNEMLEEVQKSLDVIRDYTRKSSKGEK